MTKSISLEKARTALEEALKAFKTLRQQFPEEDFALAELMVDEILYKYFVKPNTFSNDDCF
jgi:hypothetical protein